MGSIAKLVVFVSGALALAGAVNADDHRRARRTMQGQEVVSGDYRCSGTVFHDGQDAYVWAGPWLNATSGITSGYYSASWNDPNVPSDLDALAEICANHIDHVVSAVPRICVFSPVMSYVSESSNATSADARFEFSCQGTRDEVIGVIGAFGRQAITAPRR